MSVALRQPKRMKFDEYLVFEDRTETRHELIDGVIFAMTGGTDQHNLICVNLTLLIAAPLKGKCQTFQGQMKLKVATRIDHDGYYPDILVSCSPTDRERLYRSEPTLLIEVLSPSTERADRGEKMINYLSIPSLQQYVLVAQDVPQLEVMSRKAAWAPQFLFLTDTLTLPDLGLSIAVGDIYDGITF